VFPSNISEKAFDLIVKAFEALLDYCYLEDVDFSSSSGVDGDGGSGTSTSPVPLLFLCDYLQMEDHFQTKVNDYSNVVFANMASQKKLHMLYEEIIVFRASGFSVTAAQTMTSKLCYDTKQLLSKNTPLAAIADLPLWLNVVFLIQEVVENSDGTGEPRQSKSSSREWSLNIANFLEDDDNRSTVDSISFQKLTDEGILPNVDENATLVLLKEEQRHASSKVYNNNDNDTKDDDDDDDDGNNNNGAAVEALPQLTNLQNRCVESLDEAKLELDSNKELRALATGVMYMSPRVMRTYLDRTLDAYGEEKRSLEAQLLDVKKKLQQGNGGITINDSSNPLEIFDNEPGVDFRQQQHQQQSGFFARGASSMAAAAFPTVPTTAFPTVVGAVPPPPPNPIQNQNQASQLPMPPAVNQVPRRVEQSRRGFPGTFLK